MGRDVLLYWVKSLNCKVAMCQILDVINTTYQQYVPLL
jgi:hypothetical protein